MFDYGKRIGKLRGKMAKAKLDCTVLAQIAHPEANAYYYSGTVEPIVAYVTLEASVAFTNASATGEKGANSAKAGFNQFDEVYSFKKAKGFYEKFFRKHKIGRVGLDFSTEANRVAFKAMNSRAQSSHSPHSARNAAVKFEDFHAQLAEVRALKDEQEKKLIKEAQKATRETVEIVREKGFRGKTENEIAGLLEYACRKKGYALDSFPPIVATAPKNAVPHAIPAQDKCSDMILIDCGATSGQYHADYTATFYDGKKRKIKDAVEAVWEAKKAAERECKTGASGKRAAQAALKVISEYGFSKRSHKAAGLALGHSVGLNVHDGFRVEDVKLEKGMVFTIEPGIYVPGEFGVRFEDLIFL